MRLDKYLCNAGAGSRSQVKEWIKKGKISVNHKTITQNDLTVTPADLIFCNGKKVVYEEFRYIMLNKPQGVVSATEDAKERTVLECLAKEERFDLFPVGRLDKDTEGLLLLTNDGSLSHELLSPRKHVSKTYFVTCKYEVTLQQIKELEAGVDIKDDKFTAPCKAEKLDLSNQLLLTITEGRYHQVKRMMQAVSNEVVALKRLSMGSLILDEQLKPGEYRRLTEEEIKGLKKAESPLSGE